MSRNKKKTHAHALPIEVVRERHEHASSGAAGVHADQRVRRDGVLRTNRQGSRRARVRAAVEDSRG